MCWDLPSGLVCTRGDQQGWQRRRVEFLEVLLVLALEQLEGRWVVLESVKYGAPALFHTFDNAWDGRSAALGGGVSYGTGLSNKVTADDFVKLGAMRIVLVVELGFGEAVAIFVFDVGIFLQMRVRFLEPIVEKVVSKGVISFIVMFG